MTETPVCNLVPWVLSLSSYREDLGLFVGRPVCFRLVTKSNYLKNAYKPYGCTSLFRIFEFYSFNLTRLVIAVDRINKPHHESLKNHWNPRDKSGRISATEIEIKKSKKSTLRIKVLSLFHFQSSHFTSK